LSTLGARRTGGWTIALLLAGCDAGYSLAPTACDDHCLAIQRADCRDDAPADCVRDCENADGPASGDCRDVRRASDACLLDAAQSAFTCEDDKTRVPQLCLEERRLVSECLAPGSGVCFDECVRQAEACGENLSDCESACIFPDPCRAETFAYATCLQDFPVECHVWFGEETREAEDIPCRDEALRVLACDD
jgi:hypothetical protein